jgi:hypothetical protein
VQPKTWAAFQMGSHTWALRFLGISEIYYGLIRKGPIFQQHMLSTFHEKKQGEASVLNIFFQWKQQGYHASSDKKTHRRR